MPLSSVLTSQTLKGGHDDRIVCVCILLQSSLLFLSAETLGINYSTVNHLKEEERHYF